MTSERTRQDWHPDTPQEDREEAEKAAYRAKLQSLTFGMPRQGTTKVVPVLNDTTGERVGRQIEHWSGRVDAVAERVTATPNHKIFKGAAPNG